MTPETWRPVPGFEGRYSVSDLGNVRREAPGYSTFPGRLLRPSVDQRGGYLSVALYTGRGKEHRRCKVHRLVAEAFIGPRPVALDTCHRDGDETNNRVTNLYYGTRSRNLADSVMHGTHPEARKTHCKRGHEFSLENTRIESTGSRRCLTCARSRNRNGRKAA